MNSLCKQSKIRILSAFCMWFRRAILKILRELCSEKIQDLLASLMYLAAVWKLKYKIYYQAKKAFSNKFFSWFDYFLLISLRGYSLLTVVSYS